MEQFIDDDFLFLKGFDIIYLALKNNFSSFEVEAENINRLSKRKLLIEALEAISVAREKTNILLDLVEKDSEAMK